MTDGDLTRRDALAALAAAGVAGLSVADLPLDGPADGADLRPHDLATLEAVAGVVYPDAVTGIEAFVETYVRGRIRDRPAHAAGISDAVDALDEAARTWERAAYVDLDESVRADLLDRLGIGRSDPDPRGADRERIRYYLVNELLFALYTSPTGGRLVGIENPQGYPGGTASYRRGPEDPEGEGPADANGE